MLKIENGVRLINHAHLFCGLGGGAQGFNQAIPKVEELGLVGRFVCRGGIDVDEGSLANFELLSGVPGRLMDLFDREQYVSFHGCEPPFGWTEATPADIHNTFGPGIDVAFTSAPCKGFSGLLSTAKSKTDKYQALNRLTVRGMWLLLEAYKDDPIPIILFENVPRIMTRGKHLLEQIKTILRSYGYVVNEDVHDCGEIGGLAQTRNRMLLIARHPLMVPGFTYQPTKHRLRGVGEVIGKLPLPGDPIAGVMHRVPALQWQTWVRLAFVEAGKDWRSLNNLRVEDGVLKDFGLVPEGPGGQPLRDNALGVSRWTDAAPVITGNQRSPNHGRWSVADPRPDEAMYRTSLGVTEWEGKAATIGGRGFPLNGAYSVADPRLGRNAHCNVYRVTAFDAAAGSITSSRDTAVADPRVPNARNGAFGVIPFYGSSPLVAGESLPSNGTYAVADPRPGDANWNDDVLGVRTWTGTSGVVSGRTAPSNGVFSVADPRIDGHERSVQLGVRTWTTPAACVKGDVSVGTGPYAVADIRIGGKPRFNNTFRVVPFDSASPAVAGPGGPGGLAVADPRPADKEYDSRKYKVHRYGDTSRAVIAASTTGDGAFAVADPRPGKEADKMYGGWSVAIWIGPARGVLGSRTQGASTVADPRGGPDPSQLHGKYPVEDWDGSARAVIAGRDQGAFAVADPRCNWGSGRHQAILRVTREDEPTGTIPANAHSVTGGHPCVADSRREHYQTSGHYGVIPWSSASLTVSGSARHDNGFGNVADPREGELDVEEPIALPAPTQKLVCRIIAIDGTWHRPFTTLDLASLQSLLDPEEIFYQDELGTWHTHREFQLIGRSDAHWREQIGNAVPSAAAKGMAETIGETLLLASVGEGRILDSRTIWVQPGLMGLAVDSRQLAYDMDMGRI